MGDRSNIAIISTTKPETRVYLYGHGMGDESILHAARGLRSGRTDDPDYLARIIFSSMVSDFIDGETGYGISTQRTLDDHPLIVINAYEGTVHLEDYNGNPLTKQVSNAEFLAEAAGLEGGEYGNLNTLAEHIGKTK